MPIDKLIPRKLNSDIDAKLVDKASMIDALNLYAGDDESGGHGVLKNVKGNTQVAQAEADSFGANSRVLGSVIDNKTNIAYFFVFSSEGSYHGVWAYDPEGKLANDGQEAVRLIYKSSQFNFDSDGFVKGDIVHINSQTLQENRGEEFDTDAVIFFTDNKNEPRKINAYRAYNSGGSNINGFSVFSEADFITACPKTPLNPITFAFDRDPNRGTTNFKGTSGYQFAYQYVYKDGFESSISSYSDVAFPPSLINQGANPNANHDSYNVCYLSIPKPGPEIQSVKILVKEGVNGSFLFVDEVERSALFNADTYVGSYSFYNDRLSKGVSRNEVNKQFDSIPRKAKSQAVADNRLMYGNYVDGFDNVNVDCTAKVVYRERPDDFVDLEIQTSTFIGVHDVQLSDEVLGASGTTQRKSAGFAIDLSSFPDSVSSGTTVLYKVVLKPDGNWHIYNSDYSYHQNQLIGAYDQTPEDPLWDEYNNNSNNYTVQTEAQSGLDYLNGQTTASGGSTFRFAGQNYGVSAAGGSDVTGPLYRLYWQNKYQFPGYNSSGPGLPEGETEVHLGTSAANPIILKGGALLFQVGFSVTNDIQGGFKSFAATTIEELLLGKSYLDLTHSELINEGTLVQSIESTLHHSVEINNGGYFGQNYVGQSGSNPISELVMACVDASDKDLCPLGYVVFKEATAKFGLRAVDDSDTGFTSSTKKAFRLALISLDNVKPLTCFKSVLRVGADSNSPAQRPFMNTWGVIDPSQEFFDSDGNPQDFDHSEFFSSYGTYTANDGDIITISINSLFTNLTLGQGEYEDGAGIGWSSMIGFLKDDTGSPTFNIPVENTNILSVMDGEGGPGGGLSRGGNGNYYDKIATHQQGSIPYCTPFVRNAAQIDQDVFEDWDFINPGSYETIEMQESCLMFTGKVNTGFYSISGYNRRPTVLPCLQRFGASGLALFPEPDDQEPFTPSNSSQQNLNIDAVNFNLLHSQVELQAFLSGTYGGDVFRSFKSNSNHDFGIVYYDERGRHGSVNYLSNVFVPGLSTLDRPESGVQGGPVSVALTLNHEPPSWAHNFKIVYGGNSTLNRFIQYTVSNAYVKDYVADPASYGGENLSNNIYVSLNYLQGSSISYVSSFGARSLEGGISMYNFNEGDKIRIISVGDNNNRQYFPSTYEFDIVDLVSIAEPSDNEDYNIVLLDPSDDSTSSTNPRLRGEFLVLRDNQGAVGFRYQDVTDNANKWDENCIVEIYSPQKKSDEEDKFYYEMGNTYRVLKQDDQLYHAPSTVIVSKGDVWFRKGALAWKDSDFNDLIPSEVTDEFKPIPNFESVYIESITATDLQESDFKGYGRPNLIVEGAKETRREASIIYSDRTNPESQRPRYTSFNITLNNYSDYDYKKGGISYLSPSSGYLLSLQSGRASLIPLSKNIISDVSGSTNLIASNVVLGEALAQQGVQGCDSPESVVENDDKIYYASKKDGKIFLYRSGSGVKDISTNVIGSSIRRRIKEVSAGTDSTKIIGGYDSLKEEYLITIIPFNSIDVDDAVIVDQPSITDLDEGEVGIIGGIDAEDGLGVTGFQLFVDTDGDGVIGLNEFLSQSGANFEVPIAGPGEVISTPTLAGLSELASQITIADGALIAETLFDVGTAITAAGANFDEEDVLSGVISSYSSANSIDLNSVAGISALFTAAGFDTAAFIVESGTGSEGDGTASTLNPLSNYDLIAQLIQNGQDGYNVPGSGIHGSDDTIINQELILVASVLGLAAPENEVISADLNLDNIVGTADLLIFLEQFALPAPEPEPIDPDQVVFTVNEGDAGEGSEGGTGDAGDGTS
jgi:hypothetical protein